MRIKRIISIAVASIMIAGLLAACGGGGTTGGTTGGGTGGGTGTTGGGTTGGDTTGGRAAYVAPAVISDLPRTEALYFGGIQWNAVNGWSPLMGNSNNWCNDQGGGGTRTQMFETPYMYNGLDGKMYPLLADGGVDGYSWDASTGVLTYKIKPAAYWSDGTKITAYDAQATWDTEKNFTPGAQGGNTPFIESVTAVDDTTVKIQAVMVDGKPANGLMVIQFIGSNYILQKAWLDKLVERNGSDPVKVDVDPGDDVVWSGPYTKYFADDTKVVLIRDDGYWGQDASMWGKLPTPKYLVHTLYADNDATGIAFKAGEIDVNQQFFPNIQNLWLQDGLPISTYISEPPYGLCVNMPTAWYNLDIPVLQEPEIRKAIAIAVDYDAINADAMTGQSPTFQEVPRSLMNPTPGEQALFDHDKVKPLQWAGKDIDGANKLLDDSGKFPKGADGWRTYNGEKISLNACCPYGWSDWESSMEIVAAAGAKIGIEITTYFPESDPYLSNVTSPHQTDYQIFMMWTNSVAPSEPWGRIRNLMSSEFIGMENNWNGNWGHYSNPRADELIKAVPLETDPAKLKDLYTELVEIYLTEVPSFSLMYRPDKFHAVNESVWKGYTEQSDGRNVPPFNCLSGYAIADLYNLSLVK